jgi:hypothetical protein
MEARDQMSQLTLQTESGCVILREGSRLEWDSIAGIGVPGSGICVSIGGQPSFPGEPPPIAVWIDKNDGLRAFAAEVRASIGNWPQGLKAKDGLSGEGGFVVLTGNGFDRAVRDGSFRVLSEIQDPTAYRWAMDQWRTDIVEDIGRLDAFLKEQASAVTDEWETILIPDPARLQPCGNVHCDRDCCVLCTPLDGSRDPHDAKSLAHVRDMLRAGTFTAGEIVARTGLGWNVVDDCLSTLRDRGELDVIPSTLQVGGDRMESFRLHLAQAAEDI